MKKTIVIIIAAVMILSLNTCTKAENQDKQTQKNAKSVERYRKFFGEKKKEAGRDYAAQSTAGVEGASKEGLKKTEDMDELQGVKDDLYSDSIKTINKVIGNK